MADIIVTVPKTISWEEYLKELSKAEQGETMNFKVTHMPKVEKGDKCYICHDGEIKGYMLISGTSNKSFDCTTTGKHWDGNFIERTGKFFDIKPIKMKGFRGFRYFKNTNESKLSMIKTLDEWLSESEDSGYEEPKKIMHVPREFINFHPVIPEQYKAEIHKWLRGSIASINRLEFEKAKKKAEIYVNEGRRCMGLPWKRLIGTSATDEDMTRYKHVYTIDPKQLKIERANVPEKTCEKLDLTFNSITTIVKHVLANNAYDYLNDDRHKDLNKDDEIYIKSNEISLLELMMSIYSANLRTDHLTWAEAREIAEKNLEDISWIKKYIPVKFMDDLTIPEEMKSKLKSRILKNKFDL